MILERIFSVAEETVKSRFPDLLPISFLAEEDKEIGGYSIVVTAKTNGSGIGRFSTMTSSLPLKHKSSYVPLLNYK